jgi:photosystem II stability/assembly factor-like uncharacterized protein
MRLVAVLKSLFGFALLVAAAFHLADFLLAAGGAAASSPNVEPSNHPSQILEQCRALSRVDPRPELDIYGGVDELSSTPSGRLWLATRAGHTYHADDLTADWIEGSLLLDEGELLSVSHPIDRITFFTDEIGFASGYLSTEEYGPEDKIFRTEDAGRTWHAVDFGDSEWIYDVFSRENGEAWMGGSEGSFLYTNDFGRTWNKRSSPFKSMRTNVIYMEDSNLGVVGALDNGIKVTRNNGRRWKKIPTPLDQGRYSPPDNDHSDHRITRIGVFHGILLVRQDGRVFHTSKETINWQDIASAKLIDFRVEPKTNRLIGITRERQVVELNERLEPRLLSPLNINAYPVDISLVGGKVYVLDEHHGIYEISGTGTRFSFPLTALGTKPNIAVARKHGDYLWGATQYHLYISTDLGETWCRVGQVHFSIRGFVTKTPDQVIIWDGHGNNALFDRTHTTTTVLTDFGDDDVVQILKSDSLWIAYGGMQYETTHRIEVARTYFGGQFRGSKDNGFVYVSKNLGETWTKIDEWTNRGVAKVFRASSGDIYLLSYLGSVRRLTPKDNGYEPHDLIAATNENREAVPYVEEAQALYFADEKTGYLGGWIHHIGNRYFKTEDSGISWKSIDEGEFPYVGMVEATNGYFAFTPSELTYLQGQRRQPVPAARQEVSEPGEGISDLSVDEAMRPLLEISKQGPGGYRDTSKRWVVLDHPGTETGTGRNP